LEDFITLQLEYSGFWLIPAILLAGAWAWWHYRPEAPWTVSVGRTLQALRTVLLVLLLFLLLGPFTRKIERYEEAPSVVFALDNSRSMALGADSLALKELWAKLQTEAEKLNAAGYHTEFTYLSTESQKNTPNFNATSSDLNGVLREVQASYENRNLAHVLLVSDGIFTRGLSPEYSNFPFSLSTLGVGDSSTRRDTRISAALHNKMAYAGNRFPIVAEVQHEAAQGEASVLELSKNGKVLESKKINFQSNEISQEHRFLVEADGKGIQHYSLRLRPLSDEQNTANNRREIYVEVLDSRENVLILAQSPHPDVKALRLALQDQENYKVSVHFPGLTDAPQLPENGQYDLLIAHQMPGGKFQAEFKKFKEKSRAVWYILGNNTDLTAFNNLQTGLRIQGPTQQKDQVLPFFQDDFTPFTFTKKQADRLLDVPPLSVPFGDYSLAPNFQVLFTQRIASVNTGRPLWAMGELKGQKVGILSGEGLWQWRLAEIAQHGDAEAVDALVQKTVQYLAARRDKRQLRVDPVATTFEAGQPIGLSVETYNDAYEQISGKSIQLQLTDEEGNTTPFSFVNSRIPFTFRLPALPEGAYSYTASTEIAGTTHRSTGRFTVRHTELEALNLRADFGLLQRLAQQHNGDFYTSEKLSTFTSSLQENPTLPLIHSREQYAELLRFWWLLGLLVLIATAEWGLRKYFGGY